MINIKGLRQGLLITFAADQNVPWLSMLRSLEEKFVANESFFAGGRVAFDVGTTLLTPEDIQRSLALLAGYRVELLAIVTQNDATHANVVAAGIPVVLPALPVRTKEPPGVRTPPADDAAEDIPTNCHLVKGKLRAGQLIKHPGVVIVVGDINPGAEVQAGGDIIVWGKLQGTAHAGAFGDTTAVICALEMMPTLVRIADVTVRNHKGKTEMARVEQQQVVFTTWDRS
jgi:septum site-determining protein MinC